MKPIVVVFLCILLPSLAQGKTAGELRKECTANTKFLDAGGNTDDPNISHDVGQCNGYMMGVASLLYVWNAYVKSEYTVCIPDGVHVNQLPYVYVKYVNQYPNRWQEEASDLVLEALRDAWPCSNQTVKLIQESLKKRGYDPGPADGFIGPRTENAIREYQKKEGLAVDGKATLDLYKILLSDTIDKMIPKTNTP